MIKRITICVFLSILAINSLSFAEDSMTIKEYLEEALPLQKDRKIVLDRTTGILTITDTPTNHKLIRKLIKEFDVGPSQVMIEARFVEVKVSNLEELGAEFYWYQAGEPENDKILEGLSVGDAAQITDDFGYSDPTYYATTLDGIQWGRADDYGEYQHFPQSGYGMDFFIGKTGYHGNYLRAYIHALEQKGKANTLSAPKIATLSGQMASMEVSRVFPYVSEVELENLGTADHPIWCLKKTVEEKMMGISLEVTPYVAKGSKYITLDLHPEVNVMLDQKSIRPPVTTSYLTYYWHGSDEGYERYTYTSTVPGVPDSVGWPTVDTRSTQTTVVTKSGRTIILGGMIKEEEKVYRKKVPFLGSIPLLGNLFKYKYIDKEKTNLLIFITATLITPEGKEIK
ncbi:MAG: hypothetical protein KAJ66_05830 [Candidatus Omnitrophica bacterium]|nr:hypothetical protein [Candidatus Omnitrophota bacterium]